MTKLQLTLLCSLGFVLGAWLGAATPEPQITDAQRAAYWRATAEVQRAQSSLQTIVAEMRQTCGVAQLVTDAKGEPVCAPPPEPVKGAKESR